MLGAVTEIEASRLDNRVRAVRINDDRLVVGDAGPIIEHDLQPRLHKLGSDRIGSLALALVEKNDDFKRTQRRGV